jgi:ElaB/YqjD/DUF883 family membrane-anchored ribosome-binding protein
MSNESGEAALKDAVEAGASSVKQSAKETVASLKAAAGSAKDAASAAASHAKDTGEQWREQAGAFAGQAADSARAAATTAKDKTGSALYGLSKLISDTAETVDARLGPQYGDYARQAAESVAGAAKSLDDKDIDQLVGDARDFVRKSPAVAIGAAALVGFVLMRLARGGSRSSES